MENLTTKQIEDFNNPLAFARTREARVGQSVIGLVENRPIWTEDIEASYRLILGASERLETLEGNLNTMLDLSRSGESARGNEQKIEEVYGKLRSLSAGFDQIIDAVVFDGRSVFAGDPVYLDLGGGARPIDLETSRLLTYGEDGLGLSAAEATASVNISYSIDDQIVNKAFDIVGLDIAEGSYNQSTDPTRELETGTYKVKISYEGPDSTVQLTTTTGAIIESKTGVDLSGSGREWVDFDVGLRLTFEMDSLFGSFDKWDYEGRGPANLSATLNYERLDGHVLRTSDEVLEDKIEMKYDPVLSDGNGKITLSDLNFSPVSVDKTALDNGVYSLSVEYKGENSIVRLHDGLGRLQGYQFGVDLTGEKTTVDFGNGFSFDVNNTGYLQDGATLTVPVEYQHERPPLEDFDFSEYAKRIEAAIEVVAGQREVVEEARLRIEEVNNMRNLAATSAIPNTAALAASGALNILAGGGGISNPFDPSVTQARLQLLGSQLFSTTTALPAQANQSPEALAQLELQSANGWLVNYA
ncbi:MAG: hypothetical protein AB3N63_12155 [Puniceicoccaceae bacterium]